MYQCGLRAVNSLLHRCRREPFQETEINDINRVVHARELELCSDGVDTLPDPEGNYPLEVLIVALRRRGLATSIVHPRYYGEAAQHRHRRLVMGDVVGFLVGTGNHYFSIVRGRDLCTWLKEDDDRPRETHPPAIAMSHHRNGCAHGSPYAMIGELKPLPSMVLQVRMAQPIDDMTMPK